MMGLAEKEGKRFIDYLAIRLLLTDLLFQKNNWMYIKKTQI